MCVHCNVVLENAKMLPRSRGLKDGRFSKEVEVLAQLLFLCVFLFFVFWCWWRFEGGREEGESDAVEGRAGSGATDTFESGWHEGRPSLA